MLRGVSKTDLAHAGVEKPCRLKIPSTSVTTLCGIFDLNKHWWMSFTNEEDLDIISLLRRKVCTDEDLTGLILKTKKVKQLK